VSLPSIPELEAVAAQIAAFILLLFAVLELLVVAYYRLKRNWIKECVKATTEPIYIKPP
jgi:hypothetical protein